MIVNLIHWAPFLSVLRSASHYEENGVRKAEELCMHRFFGRHSDREHQVYNLRKKKKNRQRAGKWIKSDVHTGKRT